MPTRRTALLIDDRPDLARWILDPDRRAVARSWSQQEETCGCQHGTWQMAPNTAMRQRTPPQIRSCAQCRAESRMVAVALPTLAVYAEGWDPHRVTLDEARESPHVWRCPACGGTVRASLKKIGRRNAGGPSPEGLVAWCRGRCYSKNLARRVPELAEMLVDADPRDLVPGRPAHAEAMFDWQCRVCGDVFELSLGSAVARFLRLSPGEPVHAKCRQRARARRKQLERAERALVEARAALTTG